MKTGSCWNEEEKNTHQETDAEKTFTLCLQHFLMSMSRSFKKIELFIIFFHHNLPRDYLLPAFCCWKRVQWYSIISFHKIKTIPNIWIELFCMFSLLKFSDLVESTHQISIGILKMTIILYFFCYARNNGIHL